MILIRDPSSALQIPKKSQFVIWFAGLRGAIAYALAKRWGGKGLSSSIQLHGARLGLAGGKMERRNHRSC